MDKNTSFSKLPTFSCGDASLADSRSKWEVWHRGFEICLRAAKITDAGEKRDMLLAQGGIELQEIFFNLPEPEVKEGEAEEIDPYKVAIDMINEYFTPKRMELEERYQFWAMMPEAEETLPTFLKRVQDHASKCNFGETATEAQNIAVVDKMIRFLPAALRKKLLRESNLTTEDVIDRIEECEKKCSSGGIQSNGQNGQAGGSKAGACKRCGKPHAKEAKCPAWNKNCTSCGKVGHFNSVCYAKPEEVQAAQAKKSAMKRSQDFANNRSLAMGGGGSSGMPNKVWKRNQAHTYPNAGNSGGYPGEERAMKYARRMYGMQDSPAYDDDKSKGSHYSDYSYHHW